MRILQSLGVIALAAATAFGQTKTRPSFDIADVHMTPRSEWSQFPAHAADGGFLGVDRYEWHRATVLDLIKNAYGVDADKVFGGPDWLDYNRYEIAARTKPGTAPAVLKQMLQTLLADRFHLILKEAMQPLDGYVLTASKENLKIRQAEGEDSGNCVYGPPEFKGGGVPPALDLQCRKVTMAQFADLLHLRIAKPLQDSTGLEGIWDFDLRYQVGSQGPGGTTGAIIEGLATLGLKLEPGKVPQMVLTVQSVEEQPSPNPPGVTAAFPKRPPPQFEVASVRTCKADQPRPANPGPPGSVVANCVPVISLIKNAWALPILQVPAGIPKSLEERTDYSNITIIAKTPAGVPRDRDNSNAMLRALLIDRYKMAVRFEDRSMDTATLLAVMPKLTKADPAHRTGCVRELAHSPGERGRGSGTAMRLICHNMTMAQFAEQIPAYDTDMFYPVEDATGLDGAWDFTIDFDPGMSRGMQALRMQIFSGAAASANGQAVDPMRGVSLEDAIRKQLGLELKISKKPQPVFVIDHMLEKPIEN